MATRINQHSFPPAIIWLVTPWTGQTNGVWGRNPFIWCKLILLVQLTQTTKGVYMGQLSLIQFSYHVVALLDYLKSDYILVMFREQILCWTQNSYGLFITFYE